MVLAGPSSAATDRLPKAGDRCHYSLKIDFKYKDEAKSHSSTGAITETFSADSIRNIACLKRTTLTEATFAGKKQTSLATIWSRRSTRGLEEVARSREQGKPSFVKSSDVIIPAILKVGLKLSGTTTFETGTEIRTQLLVEKKERVTVPSGSFDCFVVDIAQSYKGGRVSIQTREWIAPVLGHPVKIEYVEVVNQASKGRQLQRHGVSELTSIELGGANATHGR